jgi:hypothetical protein
MPCKQIHGRVIARTLKEIENLLWVNLAGRHPISDGRTVECLRALINAPVVQQAIDRGSDTAACFSLRAVNRIVQSGLGSRATFDRLWSLMDDPDIVQALSEERNRFLRRKPPA